MEACHSRSTQRRTAADLGRRAVPRPPPPAIRPRPASRSLHSCTRPCVPPSCIDAGPPGGVSFVSSSCSKFGGKRQVTLSRSMRVRGRDVLGVMHACAARVAHTHNAHTHIRTHPHTHTHTYTRAQSHIHTRTHSRTHTHTRTRTKNPPTHPTSSARRHSRQQPPAYPPTTQPPTPTHPHTFTPASAL